MRHSGSKRKASTAVVDSRPTRKRPDADTDDDDDDDSDGEDEGNGAGDAAGASNEEDALIFYSPLYTADPTIRCVPLKWEVFGSDAIPFGWRELPLSLSLRGFPVTSDAWTSADRVPEALEWIRTRTSLLHALGELALLTLVLSYLPWWVCCVATRHMNPGKRSTRIMAAAGKRSFSQLIDTPYQPPYITPAARDGSGSATANASSAGATASGSSTSRRVRVGDGTTNFFSSAAELRFAVCALLGQKWEDKLMIRRDLKIAEDFHASPETIAALRSQASAHSHNPRRVPWVGGFATLTPRHSEWETRVLDAATYEGQLLNALSPF